MKYISLGAFVVIAMSVSGAAAQTFTIDANQSRVGFESIKYVNTHVKGSFNKYTGTFTYNDQDPTKSYVQVTVETCSFDLDLNVVGIAQPEASDKTLVAGSKKTAPIIAAK